MPTQVQDDYVRSVFGVDVAAVRSNGASNPTAGGSTETSRRAPKGAGATPAALTPTAAASASAATPAAGGAAMGPAATASPIAAVKPKNAAAEQVDRALAAAAAATKVAGMADADVSKLSATDKVALLRDIEALGKPTGELRKAQIKIFRNMQLDPDFKKKEGERADKVADAVKDDGDVKASANDWASRSADQKIKALKRVMEAQCKQLGIPTPPIESFDKAPSGGNVEDGNYDPSDGKMHFNTNAGANKTFNDAVDTVVHETSHAYQHYLVKQLQDGKLKAGDPDYTQAQMFAANDADQDYIQPDEDMGAYVAQPEENHARIVAADYVDKIQKKLTGPAPAAGH